MALVIALRFLPCLIIQNCGASQAVSYMHDYVGEGGYGKVFLCRHKINQQLYAVKKVIYYFDNIIIMDELSSINFCFINLLCGCRFVMHMHGKWQ